MEFLRARLGYSSVVDQYILDYLIPRLKKYRAVISGGIIVQTLLEETWNSSDIDVYVPEEHFSSFLQSLQDLETLVKLVDAPNYHNSFMTKNNIAYLATILIGEPAFAEGYTDKYPAMEHNADSMVGRWCKLHYDDYPLVSEFLYDKAANKFKTYTRHLDNYRGAKNYITLQVMCVKSGVPLRRVIGTFDLTFCQVLFDGERFETCGETTMDDVLAKRGRLADDYYQMYNGTLHKRIMKYTDRGFTINIDWNRICREMTINRDVMTNDQLIMTQFNSFAKSVKISPKYCADFVRYISARKTYAILNSSIQYTLNEYPQFRKYIPAFIDQIKLLPEHRAIIEQFFIMPYITSETTTAKWNQKPGSLSNLFHFMVMDELRPVPSPTCLLVGASAIAHYRGKHLKPTYLMVNEDLRYSWKNVGVDLYYKYTEHLHCNIIECKQIHVDVILRAWPVPNTYYDGKFYHFSNLILSSITFSLTLKWARWLRKERLVTNEFRNMFQLGYKYIPDNGMVAKDTTVGKLLMAIIQRRNQRFELPQFVRNVQGSLFYYLSLPLRDYLTDRFLIADRERLGTLLTLHDYLAAVVPPPHTETVISQVSKFLVISQPIITLILQEIQDFTTWSGKDIFDLILRSNTFSQIVDGVPYLGPAPPEM